MALLGRQISELHSEKERGRPSQEVANYFPVPLQVINRQRGTSLASGQHGWACSAQQLESIHIFQGGRSLTRLPRAEHKSCSASDKPDKSRVLCLDTGAGTSADDIAPSSLWLSVEHPWHKAKASSTLGAQTPLGAAGPGTIWG